MGRDLLLFGLLLVVLIMFIALGAVIGVFSVTEEIGLTAEPAPPIGTEAIERIAADLRGCLPLDHASQRFEAGDGALSFLTITSAADVPGVYPVVYVHDTASQTLVRRVDALEERICRGVLRFDVERDDGAVTVRMTVMQEDGTRAELSASHRFEQ